MSATIYKGDGLRRPAHQTSTLTETTRPSSPAPPSLNTGSEIRLADGPHEASYSEVGATGTAFFRGFIDTDEFNNNLRGNTGATTYNKMRRTDAQVKATLLIISLPIKGATWRFEAGTVNDEGNIDSDPEIEQFLNEALKQRIRFDRLLNHLLLAVPFGYEVMEKVYEADGDRIWYKKIAHRSQSTIQQWHTDEGELAGIIQRAWKDGSYPTVTIPEEPSREGALQKLVHMAVDQEGNNFEGISMLRSAYPYWFIKENALKIAAIGIERYGLGVPRGKLKEGGTTTPNGRSQVITILKNLKSGEQAYIWEPEGYEIDILGHDAAKRLDPMPLIKYCDEMIAMNVLAMALKLGSTESGSRALGDSMFGVFMLSLEALANLVAETLNEQVVKPLIALNYPNAGDISTSVKWSDMKVDDPKTIAGYLQKLSQARLITPDPELENILRGIGDLPPLPEEFAEAQRTQMRQPARRRKLKAAEQLRLELGESDYWRELRPEERHVALGEIAGRQEDAGEEIAQIAEKARNDWTDSLSDQITEALQSGDPEKLSAIAIPEELKQEMAGELADVMRETFLFGRRTVEEERQKQLRAARLDLSERMQLRDPITEAEIDKLFSVAVNEYLERLSGKVRALAVDRARAIARTVGDEITEPQIREIIDEVRAFLGPTAVSEAKPLVAESVNLGRDNAAQDLIDEIQEAIYSAILDSSLCEECESADGVSTQVGSSDYYELMPPNRRCLSSNSGRNGCRCIWVYRFAEV